MIDCPDNCPGCLINKMSYEEILNNKLKWFNAKLNEFCEKISSPLTPKQKVRYRNKTCLKAIYNKEKWNFGFTRKNEFISIDKCQLHTDFVNASISIVKEYLPVKESIPLKYYIQNNQQIVFVLKTKDFQEYDVFDKLCEKLVNIGIKGVHLHLNPSTGNKIIQKNFFETIVGEYFSQDEFGLIYTPISFQQNISELHELVINETFDFFRFGKNDVLIDLYSGVGTTIRRWTKAGIKCLGVEMSYDAVACARINAPEATILIGKCEQRIPQIEQWLEINTFENLYVYMNPPRNGVEDKVIDWLLKVKPTKIAYLSCNPLSLSDDLSYLVDDYDIVNIFPIDFFPYTKHIEALVFLEKKGNKVGKL